MWLFLKKRLVARLLGGQMEAGVARLVERRPNFDDPEVAAVRAVLD
jgi:hypothetical protein